jgi:hypothetical protein
MGMSCRDGVRWVAEAWGGTGSLQLLARRCVAVRRFGPGHWSWGMERKLAF